MIQVRGNIKNGEIIFTSDIAKHRFLEMAEGKEIVIFIDDKPTGEMRRYFEGAIVPAVFFQHPLAGWESFKDAREALKLEFLPSYVRTLKGKRVKQSRSTTELSKLQFTKLLDLISNWMVEQGLELPDPDDYKAWRDSAPEQGETYPPLARLKAAYDAVKLKNVRRNRKYGKCSSSSPHKRHERRK